MPGIEVEPVDCRTDIVFFRIQRPDMDAVSFCERLNQYGVRMTDMDPRRVRAVTNYHVTSEDIDTVLGAVRRDPGVAKAALTTKTPRTKGSRRLS